jgi:hypothetical protein
MAHATIPRHIDEPFGFIGAQYLSQLLKGDDLAMANFVAWRPFVVTPSKEAFPRLKSVKLCNQFFRPGSGG